MDPSQLQHLLEVHRAQSSQSQVVELNDERDRKRRRGWDPDVSPGAGQMPVPNGFLTGLAVPNTLPPPAPTMEYQTWPPNLQAGGATAPPAPTMEYQTWPPNMPARFDQHRFETPAGTLSDLLGTPKKNLPPVAGVDGNWICASCLEVNFRNRRNCHKCSAAKERSHSAPGAGSDGPVSGDDVIDAAAGSALLLVKHLEPDMEFDKLRWKMAKIFRTSGVGLAFEGDVAPVIDKYCDKVFGQLAQSIGDRDWLPEIDLTLVLDTAIEHTFPSQFLAKAGQGKVQSLTLAAYDRAFDDVRVIGLLWNIIQGKVQEGKKNLNKVYSALEEGRKRAIGLFPNNTPGAFWTESQTLLHSAPVQEKVQKFMTCWIKYAIELIAKTYANDPSNTITAENLAGVFQNLIKSGALPVFLKRELKDQGVTVPQPYPMIEEVVNSTYAPLIERCGKKEAWKAMQRANQPKFAYCYYHYNGGCGFGNTCRYAHHESELPPYLIFTAPWSTDT